MLRSMLRLAFGKVGRPLLILAALGLLWAAWWVWPERPLRTVVIDRVMKEREDAAVSPTGMFALLSNIQSVNEGNYKTRVIDLRNGKEVISQQQLGNKRIRYFSNDEYLIYMESENQSHSFYIEEDRFTDHHWFDTTGMARYPASSDFSGWTLVEPDLSDYAISLKDRILSYLNFYFDDNKGEHIVADSISRCKSRKIRDWSWCGFTHHDKCWTQNHFSEPQIVLREWDISFARPPIWLWLLSGVCIGFVAAKSFANKQKPTA